MPVTTKFQKETPQFSLKESVKTRLDIFQIISNNLDYTLISFSAAKFSFAFFFCTIWQINQLMTQIILIISNLCDLYESTMD